MDDLMEIGARKFGRRKLTSTEMLTAALASTQGEAGAVRCYLLVAGLSCSIVPFSLASGQKEDHCSGKVEAYVDRLLAFFQEKYELSAYDVLNAGVALTGDVLGGLSVGKKAQEEAADFLEPAQEGGSNSG